MAPRVYAVPFLLIWHSSERKLDLESLKCVPAVLLPAGYSSLSDRQR